MCLCACVGGRGREEGEGGGRGGGEGEGSGLETTFRNVVVVVLFFKGNKYRCESSAIT